MLPAADVIGLVNDVPGLGAFCIAFSSTKIIQIFELNLPISMSATPSSSISRSSMYIFLVKARHFKNQAA
jgi:hypothetical protein